MQTQYNHIVLVARDAMVKSEHSSYYVLATALKVNTIFMIEVSSFRMILF